MKTRFSQGRRHTLGLLASAIPLSMIGTARASDTWPQSAVRIIVPYPPGGVTDIVARQFAERLAPAFGQSIIVENRGGAGGTIGIDAMVKSKPDGTTFAFGAISPITLNPYLMKVGYDPLKDIIPVASVMYSPVYLLATKAFKGKTFDDAISLAKSNPDGVTIACSGYGSVGHIMIEQLRRQSRANFVPVPYKGANQMLPDAVGGQFDLCTSNPSDAVTGLIQKGDLRLLAVSAPKRLPKLPDMPTLAEIGYKEANLISLFGFFAPAGTPPEAVQRFNAEVNKLLTQSDLSNKLLNLDNVPDPGTPAQFAETIRSEYTANGKTIKEAGIKAR